MMAYLKHSEPEAATNRAPSNKEPEAANLDRCNISDHPLPSPSSPPSPILCSSSSPPPIHPHPFLSYPLTPAKLEWTENFVPGAVMTPLSIEDLSTMNLGHTCKNRKEARATKKNVTRSRNPAVRPPAPSSSSATSQPTTSHGHTQSSPSNQPYSTPILSPNNSIFSKSVAPSAKDPTPAQSSSLHAVPQRFTKVTDWKAMKTFQYELYLEQERLLEELDA
nr:hypothetical protein Iba_chr01aCG2120 [Ipomoea batatas]GMC56520.1 hypothetical protein Iba_chr01fCG7880 [Ipomoea batatas]